MRPIALRPTEICSFQRRAPEVCFFEFCTMKVCASKVCLGEFCLAEISISQVRISHPHLFQISFRKIGIVQLNPCRVKELGVSFELVTSTREGFLEYGNEGLDERIKRFRLI